MCIPHAPAKKRQPGIRREKKERKHIPFNKKLMKPDPEFVDERIVKEPEKSGLKAWISKFFD
ncbi:hypothetical protein [Hydrogenimonas sp.]